MLTKVIIILDININMGKFYMSIFVYVLESRYQTMTKQEVMKRQVKYNKKRTQKLGLANMMIYREDRELIRELAKTKGKTNADIIRELLEGF